MLNLKILGNKVQKYILTNIAAKIPELVLKGSPFNEIKNIDIIEQIESKSRCRSKINNHLLVVVTMTPLQS